MKIIDMPYFHSTVRAITTALLILIPPLSWASITFEAESYTASTADGKKFKWTETQAYPDFSGTGAMQAYPLKRRKVRTVSKAPRLDFTAQLPQGSYYICLRGFSTIYDSGNVWAGFDQDEGSAQFIEFSPGNTWEWTNTLFQPVTLAEGSHTINLWMRNAGVVIDQVVITTQSECPPLLVPSEKIDHYKVSVVAAGVGAYSVTGTASAADPDYQVKITNPRLATGILVWPESDGSFFGTIDAQPGDLLQIAISDGAGNDGPVTEVYANVFTIKNPYTAAGNWYVGQTHFHTTSSDGIDKPQKMEAAYYDAGYDFVISTDHRGTSPYFTDAFSGLTPDPDNSNTGQDLLWIRGSELGFGEVHMGAWGHTERVPITVSSIHEQLEAVRSRGGITVLNHPENLDPPFAWDWNREIKTERGFSMVEAFNGKHSVVNEGADHRLDAIDLADEYRQVWWIGTDDCHDKDDPTQFNKYALVVQTDSPVVSEQGVLAAADAGDMYIRQTIEGPEISAVEVAGNTITLTLADTASLYNVVWKRRGDEVAAVDSGVDTVSSYTVGGDEGYVRAEVERVDDGLLAYTQPFFIGNNVDLSLSASATPGLGGESLVDNDGLTVWDAGASSGSFVIDTGSLRQLNTIRIDWDGIEGRRFNYRVEASETGVFAGEQSEVIRETHDNRSAETVDFFDVYARYLRVVVTSQSVGADASVRVREVEVFDASPGGTDLYIDYVNGKDSGNGSFGSPWRTFSFARERVRPRDTLHFMNTDVPLGGMLELMELHSGKHPGATVRYQGDPVALTEIDATGDAFGFRFVNTKFVEWMYFDVHSANNANIVVTGTKKSTAISRSRIHDGLLYGVRADSDFTLTSSLIYGNDQGVFVYTDGVEAGIGIFNNVFFANRRGLFLELFDIDAVVRNNIFSGHAEVALHERSSGNVIDSHNCVDGSYVGDWQKVASVESSPLFIDPDNYDFSLQVASPCIDAGIDLDIAEDFSGNEAFDVQSVPNTGSPGLFSKDYVDIGAYEFGQ